MTLRPPRLYDRVVVTTTLGTLRSNDATATRTSFKKVCLRSFNLYSNYSYPCSRCRRTLLKLNFKGPYPSSERELKFRRCLFTSFIKHKIIRHFHVVVVQKRERNVHVRVMHVQSCCFAYKTYCFLTFSSPSASLDLKVPIGCWNQRKLKALIPRVVVFVNDPPSADSFLLFYGLMVGKYASICAMEIQKFIWLFLSSQNLLYLRN